jgi:hypothetical protein
MLRPPLGFLPPCDVNITLSSLGSLDGRNPIGGLRGFGNFDEENRQFLKEISVFV